MPHQHPLAPAARDLTPAEAEARRQTCQVLDGQIRHAIRVGRAAMWELAQRLHDFDEEAGWLALGYDTLGAWLADREVDLTESTYRRLLRVYRETAVLRGLPLPTLEALDLSKVDIVLPAVKEGRARLGPALEDAATKTARQLRKEYAASNGKPPIDGRLTEPAPAPKPDLDPTPDQPVSAAGVDTTDHTTDLAPPSTTPPESAAAEDSLSIEDEMPWPKEPIGMEPVEHEPEPRPEPTPEPGPRVLSLDEAISELREAQSSNALWRARRLVVDAYDREQKEAIA
jgi:hypothetical protein